MLILTRRRGESIQVGDNIKVTICDVGANQVRVGIEAPADIRISRVDRDSGQPELRKPDKRKRPK